MIMKLVADNNFQPFFFHSIMLFIKYWFCEVMKVVRKNKRCVLIICISSICSTCKCDKFDYGIFENFEATHELFEKEQATAQLLEETLSELKERRDTISINNLHVDSLYCYIFL